MQLIIFSIFWRYTPSIFRGIFKKLVFFVDIPLYFIDISFFKSFFYNTFEMSS